MEIERLIPDSDEVLYSRRKKYVTFSCSPDIKHVYVRVCVFVCILVDLRTTRINSDVYVSACVCLCACMCAHVCV